MRAPPPEISSAALPSAKIAHTKLDRRGRDAQTFANVAADFLKAKEPNVRPATFRELRRYLTGSHFRALHRLPLDTIARKDIAGALVKIDGAPTSARAKAAVSEFFTWALKSGLVDANPVINTPDRRQPAPRSRVLTDAELAAIWRACADTDYGRAIRLLILTGCRRQEVGSMTWTEIDRDAGTWTIPAARAKNGRQYVLPLPPAAWTIIDGTSHRRGRDFLFGDRSAKGFSDWHDGKVALDARVGDAVAPWRTHDLRRTVATGMSEIGIQPHIVEVVLNHQSGFKGGVAGVYNRAAYTKEVRAALDSGPSTLRALAEGGEPKIVRFTPAS